MPRPRLRNSLESTGRGPITPYAPSGGTIPNIGGNSAGQSAHQICSFLVAADAKVISYAIGSVGPYSGGTLTTTIAFPNIPNSQLAQQSGAALQKGQAGTFIASNDTYPLFLTFGKLLSFPGSLVCASLLIVPVVKDRSNVLHKQAYLSPGLTYTSFGVSVTLNYTNPFNTTIAASTASVEVSAELIATFPGV